jgi:hypothetical protein
MAVHRRVDPYAHRALYQDCNHTGESQRTARQYLVEANSPAGRLAARSMRSA